MDHADTAGLTDRGKARQGNEDALAIADLTRAEFASGTFEWHGRTLGERGLLVAIADGMGGAVGGEVASRIAIEQLVGALMTDTNEPPDRTLLRDVLKFLNQEIRLFAGQNPALQGMGTTMTAVVLKGERALIGQVGDSRCYLLRENQFSQLTKDQSLVQSLVESGWLTQEQADQSPHRNIILSALGREDGIEPVVTEIGLQHGDQLILCTDGLSNKLSDFEISEIVRQSPTPEQACVRLVALANERGGEDNITVIITRLWAPSLSAKEFLKGWRVPTELF